MNKTIIAALAVLTAGTVSTTLPATSSGMNRTVECVDGTVYHTIIVGDDFEVTATGGINLGGEIGLPGAGITLHGIKADHIYGFIRFKIDLRICTDGTAEADITEVLKGVNKNEGLSLKQGTFDGLPMDSPIGHEFEVNWTYNNFSYTEQ